MNLAMMMILITIIIIAQLVSVNSFLAISPSLSCSHSMNNVMALDATASKSGVQLVWFTGSADLRVSDHGGLLAATSMGEDVVVVPLFILDPTVHLRCRPPHLLRRLHASLISLKDELQKQHNCNLIIRHGSATEMLPLLAKECGATTCHVVIDDVCHTKRTMMITGCASLEQSGFEVRRWNNMLRGKTTYATDPSSLPSTFPEYAEAVRSIPPDEPKNDCQFNVLLPTTPLVSDGIPSLAELLDAAEVATPLSAKVARSLASKATLPPYEHMTVRWCNEGNAKEALASYVVDGKDSFADAYLYDAIGNDGMTSSLETAAAQRLIAGCTRPSEGLALREAATRVFSPALSLGVISPREVLTMARKSSTWPLSTNDRSLWGRSSSGALNDVVEWREWFDLLARRSLAIQTKAKTNDSGDTVVATQGDKRSRGEFRYWRWQGAYLVRYEYWPAGKNYDGQTPALLLVHGFAASCDQWERLVHSLREHGDPDNLPPIYAVDLVGFGHSEKPGISYTQYTWEAQIVDFAVEVLEGVPIILAGNSIGGGLVAGAAATLGEQVRGVVLCNTAGVLKSPEDFTPPVKSVRDATLQGALSTYKPVPLFEQPALDLFGEAIISLIFPQVPKRLADIYGDRRENADSTVIFAIQQGASSPGSANVIGSGQKLANPQRPLNEVLNSQYGFGGPVLVAQGKNDRVSGPARAQERAQLFKRLRSGVTVRELEAGHCPHDECPEMVAQAILDWLPDVLEYKSMNRILDEAVLQT